MLSPATERQYASAVASFHAWSGEHDVSFPASYADVARYLRRCGVLRGASAVPVHLSAIARLHRDAGHPFDTKAPVIQRVVSGARRRGLW